MAILEDRNCGAELRKLPVSPVSGSVACQILSNCLLLQSCSIGSIAKAQYRKIFPNGFKFSWKLHKYQYIFTPMLFRHSFIVHSSFTIPSNMLSTDLSALPAVHALFAYAAPWNVLSSDVVSSPSLSTLIFRLKTFVFSCLVVQLYTAQCQRSSLKNVVRAAMDEARADVVSLTYISD